MLIDRLAQQLIKHEGLVLKPYKDTVGKLTIGVGRNIQDKGISRQEAEFLLQNDIKEVMAQAQTLPFWDALTDNRKLVILDMIFNLGWAGFMGFKNTIRLISQGKYKQASQEMLSSKWASQVNGRAVTLASMMEKG